MDPNSHCCIRIEKRIGGLLVMCHGSRFLNSHNLLLAFKNRHFSCSLLGQTIKYRISIGSIVLTILFLLQQGVCAMCEAAEDCTK